MSLPPPTEPPTAAAHYPRPMPNLRGRAAAFFGVDDEWTRPRPPIGRQDVVLAVAVEAVRGNVRERVETLTGYRVRSLDVTVSALADPVAAPARTGRVE